MLSFVLMILMFIILVYSCLVAASREDERMEQMHIRWELEQQMKKGETVESQEKPAEETHESEVDSV